MNSFGLLLLAALMGVLRGEECLGYDSTVAALAAQYASCSSVTTEYQTSITAWNYTYCVNAQPQKRFIRDLSFVERRGQNLLGLYLYDQ
jgi:hypothetical protein